MTGGYDKMTRKFAKATASINYALKGVSFNNGPRVKLVENGSYIKELHELSPAEILAAMCGRKTLPVSLEELETESVSALEGKGVPNEVITMAKLAFAFHRKLREAEIREARGTVKSPEDIFRILGPDLKNSPIEVFKAVYLDKRYRVVGIDEFQGDEDGARFEPLPIFDRCRFDPEVKGVILVHNHPDGDPTPSTTDVDTTRRMLDLAAMLRVKLLDHIIIAGDRYLSMQAQGLME
jgi:DNA repair protein RadC